ncbi:MAG: hypothetical protein JKX68_02780 [Flavobacteriales bacterium]|nr:hypothetical protein [Flavobacteriales bacterium]
MRFFTSPTFFNYAYKAHLISENRFVLDQLGTHSIKQYYFPLQLMYRYQLGNSSTFITPKIGLTITSHTENIKSNSRIYDGYINTDTIIDIIHHTATVETPFIKKLNLNLSSGLAVKFVKPKIGELEIGLSAILNITNPKSVTYIMKLYMIVQIIL